MIRSFADKATEQVYFDQFVRAFAGFDRQARRKLQLLNAAQSLIDLTVPPGNRLEPLKGDLAGWHSIRVNSQWRIIFKWQNNDAFNVQIIDYH